ncbi:dihydrolipoamide acetyltransferase [Parvularcula bermudensis HTCC2503]|uniref:Dihydrolipoyllysine-residue succinyltransferase component of 2-oxoglutarate dehydrogenase complex n=1 Tax=Parvularcula bermudensis (strain ATCC BAA-594 / HTCC2503 / KCTC 12087) TaxID=314260 RepID=E0TEX2_PARBH|nr:2-oxoglutarate dehydrogenase complex dihydrolipoyllysine-residue succinyltransferase [Parvularcula bermudensis]ADM10065.1 dihydrolipoamide acetyltransferase [Parvularcula bermudensis HTCC2503]
MTEIRVPTLGESVTEATVGEWLVKEGDRVSVDDPLVELETDKVSVSVPAPMAGVITSITAKEGDTVELDALLGEIGEANGTKASSSASSSNGSEAAASSAPTNKDEGGEPIEVLAPSSGESVTEADVGEWLVKIGDQVAVDETLVSLETDKAAVDVSAPSAGTITEIRQKEGETVTPGTVLAIITQGGGAVPETKSPEKASSAKPDPAAAKSASTTDRAALSPAPRRMIQENGLDPASIAGSGKDGRITKGDVVSYLKDQEAKPTPTPSTPSPSAPRDLGEREERVKMSRLRQTIARRLKESQNTAAMLTTFNDVDMSAVMEVRSQYKDLFEKKHGVKLGFMSFFVKACVHALREIPDVNAEIDGTDIIYKDHYDIGIAVGTEKGLVVPVLRDAEQKSLAEIEKGITDFGRRARDGQLSLEEMQGGTFTITNGGVYGSLMSTPILNMPQSGILGMHRIEKRPIVVGNEIVVRPMMYLALSYDHRIVDGKGAVTFLVRVKENLEDPQRLLLDL